MNLKLQSIAKWVNTSRSKNVEKDADDETIEDIDWNTTEYDAHIETTEAVYPDDKDCRRALTGRTSTSN